MQETDPSFVQVKIEVRDVTEDIVAMKEKVRLAQEEVDSLLTKLNDIRKKHKDAQDRKDGCQAQLNAAELDCLRFRSVAQKFPDSEAARKCLSDAEEKFRISSTQLEPTMAELRALELEERALYGQLGTKKDSLLDAEEELAVLEGVKVLSY